MAGIASELFNTLSGTIPLRILGFATLSPVSSTYAPAMSISFSVGSSSNSTEAAASLLVAAPVAVEICS